MRLPRDLSRVDLVGHLRQLGYAVSRQKGSHMRLPLIASKTHGEHHITIPNHNRLRIGTLMSDRLKARLLRPRPSGTVGLNEKASRMAFRYLN